MGRLLPVSGLGSGLSPLQPRLIASQGLSRNREALLHRAHRHAPLQGKSGFRFSVVGWLQSKTRVQPLKQQLRAVGIENDQRPATMTLSTVVWDCPNVERERKESGVLLFPMHMSGNTSLAPALQTNDCNVGVWASLLNMTKIAGLKPRRRRSSTGQPRSRSPPASARYSPTIIYPASSSYSSFCKCCAQCVQRFMHEVPQLHAC